MGHIPDGTINRSGEVRYRATAKRRRVMDEDVADVTSIGGHGIVGKGITAEDAGGQLDAPDVPAEGVNGIGGELA